MQVEQESTIPLNLIRIRPRGLDGCTPPPAVDVDYVVRIRTGSEANFYAGLADDEPVGVFVPTYRRRSQGSIVAIALDVPGRPDLIVTSALVRWLRDESEHSDASPGMGVEFLALSKKARETINRFARRRTPLLWDVD